MPNWAVRQKINLIRMNILAPVLKQKALQIKSLQGFD
jgi:hypothetical protein